MAAPAFLHSILLLKQFIFLTTTQLRMFSPSSIIIHSNFCCLSWSDDSFSKQEANPQRIIIVIKAVINNIQMSSITRANYPSVKKSLQQLAIRAQIAAEYCKHVVQAGKAIDQSTWRQFQEDVRHGFRSIMFLSQTIEQEWQTNDELQTFIKNLEVTNSQLIEEAREYLYRLEDVESQNESLKKIINEMSSNHEKQASLQEICIDEKINKIEEYYQIKCELLENELVAQQKQIQELSMSQQAFQLQLSLKQTELQLAELVLDDLRANRSKLQPLGSTISPEKEQQDNTSELQIQSNSDRKLGKRQSSLLEDLTDSQLIYEPRANSYLFKSVQTIQQTVEDHKNEMSTMQINIHKCMGKKSKSILVRLQQGAKDQQSQTQDLTLCGRYYKMIKDKVVSSRIKK